ncbi:hypothetical protein Cme02nite_45080 [Catellatospora methionotrophica]|uniref:Uncharacterized protein n=1 Tax=Catellatospora methionotrophica TaxID=121620 RepID=A0A8J3LJ75_9ACTN|nr:hypothetical protein [Catellatospora methionotrophica]GIG16176.1 hypothetical protein Cme02nite_45080 [Catellatospora methionotrophica]
MTHLITRQAAVDAIAGHLADRTAFVVLAPPDLLAETTGRLRHLPGWTGYLDTGRDTVAQGNAEQFAALCGVAQVLGRPAVAVLTIPKTVPARRVAQALRRPVAADGSQDVLVVRVDGGPVCWPLLFVDALERVEPAAAAQLHAEDLAGLS